MSNDLRFALRGLRCDPGLTLAAILALALGIGANVAIFSAVEATLLRPLPYPDAQRLIVVCNLWHFGDGHFPVRGQDFLQWRARVHSFTDMAALAPSFVDLTGIDQPESLRAAGVTPNLFPLLGVRMVLGRPFAAAEAEPGKDGVVILSHSLWSRRFGRSAAALGRTIELNGRAYRVIGVLPSQFHPAGHGADIWLPMAVQGAPTKADGQMPYFVLARLRLGATLEQARRELRAIPGWLAQQSPPEQSIFHTEVFSIASEKRDNETTRLVLILQLAVGFVLLIACTNVANLLLARSTDRTGEIAIRAALGASRGRLARLALTESLLLAAMGGAAGLLLALWAISGMAALDTSFDNLSMNWQVLCFAVSAVLVTGLASGLAPALQLASEKLNWTIVQGGRAHISDGRGRLRSLLVITEMALALILVAGAGLTIRSFLEMLAVQPEFDPGNVIVMHIRLPQDRYPNEARVRAFTGALLARIEAVRGVESVAIADGLPSRDTVSESTFQVKGEPQPKPGHERVASEKTVSEDYFRTTRTPLLRGRVFTQREAEDPASRVIVINQVLARQLRPDGAALGMVLVLGTVQRTVVGIVGGARQMGLDQSINPEIFSPSRNIPHMSLMVRTGDPMRLSKVLTRQVWAIDPDLPVSDVSSLEEQRREDTLPRKSNMILFAALAGLTLLMAAVGLYGVLSYAVARRTREIGVRIALGAEPREVVRMVVRHGLVMALAGIALGGVAALALTRLLGKLLFGVGPSDPLTFGAVALCLAAVALLASYLPARWAAHSDPMDALRIG
ncbi:MAG TPA: ABC transporter permease [Bryobacteraceae bacterium]|nr:ABC transporter permease [Bryobacteraceae bacterium]